MLGTVRRHRCLASLGHDRGHSQGPNTPEILYLPHPPRTSPSLVLGSLLACKRHNAVRRKPHEEKEAVQKNQASMQTLKEIGFFFVSA